MRMEKALPLKDIEEDKAPNVECGFGSRDRACQTLRGGFEGAERRWLDEEDGDDASRQWLT